MFKSGLLKFPNTKFVNAFLDVFFFSLTPTQPTQTIRFARPQSVLYLNDRAFSKQTGEQLYGNFKNMPYILDKISASCCKDFNWLTGKATSNKIIQEKLRKLNCNSNGTPIIVSN